MNTKWDLSLLLKSENPEEIENLKRTIKSKWLDFKSKWENNNEYLKNPQVLKQALEEYESLSRTYGIDGGINYYFELKDALNQGNPQIKANINKIEEFATNLYNEIQFFNHRISKIPKQEQDLFLNSPELKNYKHYLERCFQEAEHLLSEDQEKVATLLSKTAKYNWVQMVESFIANDTEKVLTEVGVVEKRPMSLIGPMIETRNEKVRESAFKALLKIRERWSSIAENEINSILEYKRNIDQLRKFPRPDSARHLADDIDTDVVDAMVNSVTDQYKTIHKYFKLKKEILKKKKLKSYEALLGIEYLDQSISDSNIRKYTFEEAVELVGSVMGNLNSEFKTIYTKFFEEGRVDVFPQKGKANGAFCASIGKDYPVYIMLNFTGKLQDCLTLAHEMGHGINDELMKIQNELSYGTVLSTAEVASTFMEDFVWQKIYDESNDEQKFVLIMKKIEEDIGTIFMQVACYTFEQELHKTFREKGYLSKEEISNIFISAFKPLYGNSVEINKTKNKWVIWSHIRNYFYVYSYASGLLISKSLQKSVKDNPNFITKVKEFLSSGISKSPKDTFMDLGIDITDKKFWSNGLTEISDLIDEATRIAKVLGKI